MVRKACWVFLVAAVGLGGCAAPPVEGEPVVHGQPGMGEPTYMGRTLADWASGVIPGTAQTREQASIAMAALGPASLGYATEWLSNPDAGVRLTAVEVIRQLGPEAAPAAANLVVVLRDERPEVRAAAAQAVGAVEATDAALVGDVGRLLQDEPWFVRYQASRTLGELGLEAREFLPALEHHAHNDPDIRVRRESALARDVIKAEVARLKMLRGR